MTDRQFNLFVDLVVQILKKCKSLDDAIEILEALRS